MCKIRLLLFSGFLAFAVLQSSAYAFQTSSPKLNYNPPVIENNTQSVTVILSPNIRYGKYTLLITNNSTKNIITVGATAFFRKKITGFGIGGDLIRPILLAGKTIELVRPLPELDTTQPLEKFLDPSEEPKVVITAIVFDDLTYEGDQRHKVQAAGRFLGYKIQSHRLINLFQKALMDVEQDQAKVLEKLRQQVSQLIEEANETDIKPLEQRLAPLTPSVTTDLKMGTSLGLGWEKGNTLSSISHFEKVESVKGVHLKTWIASQIEFYDKWIKRLSAVL
jgi:hypothetical protein